MNDFLKNEKIAGVIIDDESKLASVLIPLIKIDGKTHVLFEQRSSSLPDQPGDICFPGGIIEEGENSKEAAVREATEELLISEDQIELLGPSYIFHAPGITIFPYVANIKDYNFTYSKDETAEVFSIPLEFFVNTLPEKYELEWSRKFSSDFPFERIVGGKNYKWRKQNLMELFYNYDGRNIWGVTAKIIYYSLIKYALGEYKIEY